MSSTVDYGIDLGTTNSCIAKWENSSIRVFQNNDQMNVTPSAIHILKTGRVIVGRRAKAALLADAENVSVEFKRWMGQKDRKNFKAAQRVLSAEDLSAEVLKALREDVRRQAGVDVTSAVVTVPAAFGALQCEATARAAQLAGIEEATLLQEPIAAAIGYGVKPDSANQRWLVFDLGGGTLDIAVISTKDGRLNIIEHRGNNLLGGKDIDRLIVDQVLLPEITSKYELKSKGPDCALNSLLPRLRVKAEEAKVDLSSDEKVVISLFDVGEDDSGEDIELDISFTRAQLESLMQPLLDKCCSLAIEALASARIEGSDLNRILLVGGPTQSPILRSILSSRLGAPVDFSADPMTVVACGAAVYASTLERSKRTVSTSEAVLPAVVGLKLAYDAVSSNQSTTIGGRVLSGENGVEVKIDSEGGLWTSGWIKPKAGLFEVTAPLQLGGVTTFWVYARNEHGHMLETDTPEFKVRQGLVPSAPPLPHTLSVEVVKSDGKPVLDPILPKGSPLPLEKTVKYRAKHTLRPGDPDSDITIKLWEGEFFSDPDANEWVGRVVLSHDKIHRAIPEQSEIEVTIQIDSSRRTTVTAFVPHLNQHFSFKDELYVAQREEQDFADLSAKVSAETESYRARLDALESTAEDKTTQAELRQIREELNDIEATARKSGKDPDPDNARRVVEASKVVRGKLSRLELQVGSNDSAPGNLHFVEIVESTGEVITQFGSSLEQQQFALLKRELERAVSREDTKGAKRAADEIDSLRWRTLFKHDWFWREIFDSLCEPGTPFINQTQADSLIAKGRTSIASGDGQALREVVRSLWKLQPQSLSDDVRERAVRSGLRKY